jgi:hypothetical protein
MGALAQAQANPCACQQPLSNGVYPDSGIPPCPPGQWYSANCTEAEANMPFCAGIPYGQPGYEQCVAADAAQATDATGAFGQTVNESAGYNAIIASLPPPPTPKTPATPAATPTPPAAGSGVTQSQVTTAATTSNTDVSGSTTAVAAPSDFAWFTESMFDGIPNWALLAGAGLGLFLLFGGRR